MKMRILKICIAVFVLIVKLSSAQSISLIPLANAEWEYEEWMPESRYRYHQYIIADTIIDSKSYTKFRIVSYSYSLWGQGSLDTIPRSTIDFFLRINNGKLLRRIDAQLDSIIFDSNWNVGDTIVVEKDYNSYYFLDKIDTVSYGGIERRKWNFIKRSPTDFDLKVSFIEGIGSEKFTLLNPLFKLFWEGEGIINCFMEDNEYVLNEYCKFCVSVNSQFLENNSSLFPNPVVDNLIVNNNEGFSQIMIYNLQGKILISLRLEGNRNIINVKSLTSGLYFVRLKNKNVTSVIKFIKQ